MRTTCTPTYLLIYLPTYLRTYLPTYVLIYLPTYLRTYLPTYILIYLPTPTYIHLRKYLPTYLPTNLLTYQPTYLPTYQEQAQSTITKKNLPLKGENKEFGTETFIITGSLIVRDNRPCRVLLRFKSWDKIQH